MKRIFTFCFLLLLLGTFLPTWAQDGLTFYANGENLRRQAQYDLALREFNQAILREPQNYRYIFGKAQCQVKLKTPNDALVSLQKVIQLKSTFAPAYALMARIYAGKKELKKATQLYDIAFRYEKDPNLKIRYKLYVIKSYVHHEEFEVAHRKIAEAKIVAPHHREVRLYDAQVSNRLGKYEAAKASILSIEDKIRNLHYSENASFYYELGYAHYHLEEYGNAFRVWQKAYFGIYKTKIEQFSPEHFNKLAAAYADIYEFDKSQIYIEHILKIDPEHADAYALLAKIKKRTNIDQDALYFHERAAQHEDNLIERMEQYKEIAKIHLGLGEYNEAISASDKALKIKQIDAESLFLKALSYYKQDHFGDALGTLQYLIAHNRSTVVQSRCYFLMGVAYKRTGADKEARKAFTQAKAQPYKSACLHELRLLMKELK